jgi:hypothetical protein
MFRKKEPWEKSWLQKTFGTTWKSEENKRGLALLFAACVAIFTNTCLQLVIEYKFYIRPMDEHEQAYWESYTMSDAGMVMRVLIPILIYVLAYVLIGAALAVGLYRGNRFVKLVTVLLCLQALIVAFTLSIPSEGLVNVIDGFNRPNMFLIDQFVYRDNSALSAAAYTVKAALCAFVLYALLIDKHGRAYFKYKSNLGLYTPKKRVVEELKDE